jgi:pyruvate kinase
LMLTEETCVGSNPLQNVLAFDCLIRAEESKDLRKPANPAAVATEPDQSVAAALRLAEDTRAEAVVIITRSGQSAIACAALRPQSAQVFVFTPDARLARRLPLCYALNPIVLPSNSAGKTTTAASEKVLRERKLLTRGAKIILLTDWFDPAEQAVVKTEQRELT